MPKEVREELTQARDNLDTATHIWIWGFLFMIWTIWAWWAFLVSFVMMYFSYKGIFQSARIYGQLLESSFDLYRNLLYEKMPLPKNPDEEYQKGKKLNQLFVAGNTLNRSAKWLRQLKN
ncbi:MAG: hypothetical protein HC887_07340 [Desulfobacteraceae bacterium]|nr:hypothetical protein [Desulfobacteraceae bacterium]